MQRFVSPLSVVVIFCALIGFIPNANAIGLGGYFNIGQGSMSATAEGSYSGNDYEYDFDADMTNMGFGFVLDTCVANDSLFNYRLQIGYESIDDDLEDEFGNDLDVDLTGFAFTNDFGFGVFRASFMRLWVGPELRLSFGTGEPPNDDWQISFFTLGIGPAIGANFHIGSSPVSLAVKMSYLLESSVGIAEYDGIYDYDDETITGSGGTVYFTFSVLFRLGDAY